MDVAVDHVLIAWDPPSRHEEEPEVRRVYGPVSKTTAERTVAALQGFGNVHVTVHKIERLPLTVNRFSVDR